MLRGRHKETMLLQIKDITERFSSEIGLYKELAALLCEREGEIESLNALATGRDAARIAYIAHKLKGAAGILGAELLADTAGELEEAARSRTEIDYDLVSVRIRELKKNYRETCEAIREFVRENEKPS